MRGVLWRFYIKGSQELKSGSIWSCNVWMPCGLIWLCYAHWRYLTRRRVLVLEAIWNNSSFQFFVGGYEKRDRVSFAIGFREAEFLQSGTDLNDFYRKRSELRERGYIFNEPRPTFWGNNGNVRVLDGVQYAGEGHAWWVFRYKAGVGDNHFGQKARCF